MLKIVVAMAVAASAPVCAQEAAVPMVIGGPASATTLRSGTPVNLRTVTNLTTKGKHLNVGERFALEVADPVLVNGQVVIPVGTPAVGEITSVRNKGMWGKSGNIESRLLYITTNDRRIRISGSIGDKGVKAGGGAIAASALVFLPAGFFMTGTSAVIPPGTPVAAIVNEDVPLAFATPTAAPMTVQTAPMTVQAATIPVQSPPAASIVPASMVQTGAPAAAKAN